MCLGCLLSQCLDYSNNCICVYMKTLWLAVLQ
jgi:hypothetical protein